MDVRVGKGTIDNDGSHETVPICGNWKLEASHRMRMSQNRKIGGSVFF
jgi:hypothetical protein